MDNRLVNTDLNDADTLYTDDIRYFVHNETQVLPKGLAFDIVEYVTHLSVVLYRDNFETFDGEDKAQIAGVVGRMINKIRQDGIPCLLEVDPSVRNRRQ